MYRSEERIPYQTLKSWALDAYFDFCRDSGFVDQWSHKQVLARVVSIFEDGFERPIEDLMWHVILLVLSGGWYEDIVAHESQLIRDKLIKRDIEASMNDIPVDELQLFRHDLKILKLIA